MSKKNLLNEGTVRRFMKLAEIEPLTGQFVKKLNEADYMENPEDVDPIEELEKELEFDAADMMPDMSDDADGRRHDGVVEEEADYQDSDDIVEEELDGTIDEELDAFLAEIDLDEADYQDDEDMEGPEAEGDEMGIEDLEDDEMEMDVEAPAPAGGLDPEEIKAMVKDAVMDALKQLVDDGELDISMDSTEEVDVEEPEEPEEPEDEEDEDDEEMVTEVARRVMKRIINSRRR